MFSFQVEFEMVYQSLALAPKEGCLLGEMLFILLGKNKYFNRIFWL